MQAPIFLMVRKRLHALTRKFVTEILVSSLATLFVMAVFPNLAKPSYVFTRNDALLTSAGTSPAADESSDTLDDFMERVALSHISGRKASPVAASQEAIVAMSEPTTDTGAPPAPSAAAGPRHERTPSKVHAASNVAKIQPPLPPLATVETAAGPAPAAIAPAVALAAPPKAELALVAPLQYGMHLVSNIGTIISVSQTRVVESVASVGDTLTSLVKKL
jgi:hypothetical protein